MLVPKICLITCYDQPDYIRAKTLRTAFGAIDGVELVIIKNRHKGLLRYLEVMAKLVRARLSQRPDLYFLTFRGYEMLPFVRLATLGKPLVFDEFINPIEQIAYENHYIKPGGFIETVARLGYRIWLKTVDLIVTDTPSHATYSARLMKLPLGKYLPLIVSTDEQTFAATTRVEPAAGKPFRIFYYGLKMMPLHGLSTVIEAMLLLKDQAIELNLIGGDRKTRVLVEQAVRGGARIAYRSFVPFAELPGFMSSADVCLGGPFGDTVQSQFVITGKTYQFLQMGCPVIVGRNLESGLWTDKKDVLIVKQANPHDLAEAIIWAQTHPTELAEIGRAGQKLYRTKLSNKVLTAQLELMLTNQRLA